MRPALEFPAPPAPLRPAHLVSAPTHPALSGPSFACLSDKFQKLAKTGSIWNYWRVQTLTQKLIDHGLSDRTLSERQIERVVDGTAAQRYALVNRALKTHELVRVRRGLYLLAQPFRTEPAHPFVIAQSLAPGSYVSFETALNSHGWIPESVRVTASVVPGRKSSSFEHPVLGTFTFHPLALNHGHFLEFIERQEFGSQAALVAQPLRALMDLVCLGKFEWQGLGWLTEGLRIEQRNLERVTRAQIQTLGEIYKQKRTKSFLLALAKELHLD